MGTGWLLSLRHECLITVYRSFARHVGIHDNIPEYSSRVFAFTHTPYRTPYTTFHISLNMSLKSMGTVQISVKLDLITIRAWYYILCDIACIRYDVECVITIKWIDDATSILALQFNQNVSMELANVPVWSYVRWTMREWDVLLYGTMVKASVSV